MQHRNNGLSSSSMPKELLPQLETEEDLEQILADAGEGDTTNGTTDDDESPISTDISEADIDSNIESELLHCFQQKVHLTFVLWFSSVSRPEFAVLIGLVFVHVE
jgi:hypothetical protein